MRAAVDTLAKHGIAAGAYSTTRYWRHITGGAQLRIPVWVASSTNQLGAPAWCTAAKAFTGGEVWLVQALPGQFDTNWVCNALADVSFPRSSGRVGCGDHAALAAS